VPPLDPKIDDLYKGPLKEFVARRTALARTLTGDEARRVKALQKPTVVPWAVNQLYWHTRAVYDRLATSGAKLRSAQIAALKGKANDVRRATEEHRRAVADAVAEAQRLASDEDAHPGADDLMKTLEAISLARDLPEQPGRLTKPLQPAGFEALAGIPVKAPPSSAVRMPDPARAAPSAGAQNAELKRRMDERRKKRVIERAEASVAGAKAAEARARAAWERAKQALAAAERKLADEESS